MKILILKPSSLGDVVQALPVLRLLKQHWPSSEIYWWLEKNLLPLLEGDPDLAGIIPFGRNGWKNPMRWPEAFRSIRTLREHSFDLVIDLQGLLRSALVGWLTRGGTTVGLDDPREGARAFYDHAIARPAADGHAVDWYLAVLHHLKVPVHSRFVWLPCKKDVKIREKWPLAGQRWILLQPGARWETKRWPAEYFAELVIRLAKQLPEARFAVLGSEADRAAASEIIRAQPERCLDLTGQTSLPEMVEWIRAADLMITNDTGPMHVAAALGKPVVALFGPTDPRRTGPYGQSEHALTSNVPCAPCFSGHCVNPHRLECLHSMTPTLVASRAIQLLSSERVSESVS